MALRKQTKHISSDSQQIDENTQDDDSATDRDTGDEFSSLLLSAPTTREKRRRERENKVKHKAVDSEMTEEEMMDLALRLSEREASVSALQQQQEEEAVMKAIQESMVSQTQPCLSSSSKTLLANASLRLGSRRKLLYSNGVSSLSAADQGRPEDCSAAESDLKSEANRAGDKKVPCSRKRKRKAGSPLLEMPDLSQSSPCSFEPFSAPLDSPQSSDSTQIDDSQLQKSPVFPQTGCRAAVRIDRLSQDLLETCRSSGFVLCSQDSWALTEPRSPTFLQSNPVSCPKSPVFSGSEQVDNGQVEQETSPAACKHHRSENTDFMSSSEESLSPSARSRGSKSPVFPKSPQKPTILPPSDGSSFHKNLDPGRAEESHEPSTSPVFGKTEPQLKKSAGPSASERRSCECEEKLDRREKTKSDGCQGDEFTIHPPKAEKLDQKSEDSAETELTSDMTLIWTDEDEDDNTLHGSPSPVFPEERPLHQADGQAASLTHQDQTKSDHRKQLSTTEEETRPVSRQEEDCRASPPPGQSSGGPTVHYYWGVPFCPRGLDPDTYTQVILAQMQVYQMSLKHAQRGLLRKAEWGEAIHPQPEKSPSPEASAESPQLQVPRRKGLRLRGRKITEAAESPPAEEEERKEEEEQEKEKDDEEQMDTDDYDVCPETQLSNDDTQDQTEAEAEPPAEHPEPPEVEMILQLDSPVRDEQQKTEEEEEEAVEAHREAKGHVSGCGGGAGSRAAGEETEAMEVSRDQDTEKKRSRGLHRSSSPELEPAVVPRSPDTSVDCPICQASFPASEIELHAAYCDGEVAVVGERRPDGDRFQGSVKLPRKRTRRAERTAGGINDSSDVCSNQEKCYICQKSVPLREYTRHTESCLERTRPKANLLSALERTESRDSEPGPSGSKVQPDAVIDLRDDDDEEEAAASAFRINDSPIRSFTSISEATGCLIDFKKQHQARKPNQRRR